MNWIIDGIAMFASSVGHYLTVRKSSLLKTPTQVNNLAMFIIPIFLYISIAIYSKTNLAINPYQLFVIVILSIFFAYYGNMFSLKSIEYAPNPGYSLIISKSYVLFTTLVAVVVFGSELTSKGVVAILLIVFFSALVTIDKPKTKLIGYNKKWLPLSILAFFCWGMLALTSKYLLEIGVNVLARLIYSMAIVSIFIFIDLKKGKINLLKLDKDQYLVFLLIGLFAASFNYFMQQGYDDAPNIGYINAINASSISAVTIFSSILFKDEFSLRKLVGVLGVTAGLILLIV